MSLRPFNCHACQGFVLSNEICMRTPEHDSQQICKFAKALTGLGYYFRLGQMILSILTSPAPQRCRGMVLI